LLILQSHWSLPILGNKLKKFYFVNQTISHLEARTQAGNVTRAHWGQDAW